MKVSSVVKILVSLALSQSSEAFTPSSGTAPASTAFVLGGRGTAKNVPPPTTTTNKNKNILNHRSFPSTFTHLSAQKITDAEGKDGEGGFFSDLTIQPGYAAFYLTFLSVATYMSINEASGASQTLINNFLADPVNPGFGSSLFETVWNAIGLIGLPLACLIMPTAKGQKLNPTPFLFASMFAGYGSLGIFMTTRKNDDSSSIINIEEDLGWFTKNVLENKIFNWVLVAFFTLTYVNSGAAQALVTDFGGTFTEFKEMISGSALGITSSVDFMILCLTGATLVPEDLKRRGVDDAAKANVIAASTVLVPAVGLALYTALRPSLEKE